MLKIGDKVIYLDSDSINAPPQTGVIVAVEETQPFEFLYTVRLDGFDSDVKAFTEELRAA